MDKVQDQVVEQQQPPPLLEEEEDTTFALTGGEQQDSTFTAGDTDLFYNDHEEPKPLNGSHNSSDNNNDTATATEMLLLPRFNPFGFTPFFPNREMVESFSPNGNAAYCFTTF
jgi:hypothetical protein